MGGIHDRMPGDTSKGIRSVGLDRSVQDVATLRKLLHPYPAEEMRAYPVSAKVGNVRNDGPELIEEVSP